MSQMSMLDLFRLDARNQMQTLSAGLLVLERSSEPRSLEECMRAAHSFKGAARIVGLDAGVRVAHAMEDCFVAAQRGTIVLRRPQVDVLLRGVDLLTRIAETQESNVAVWGREKRAEIDAFLLDLKTVLEEEAATEIAGLPIAQNTASQTPEAPERALHVTAHALNRLLGLAGESLVESRRLNRFTTSLLKVKRVQHAQEKDFNALREALAASPPDVRVQNAVEAVLQINTMLRKLLDERLDEWESFEHHATDLARRLYDEALACRMRPFSDGVIAFPRLVRDVARELGKEVHLQIIGESTEIDRDILEQLEAPLGHLLRNAIDHGIESPDARRAAGKEPEGLVTMEARHSSGMLHISISDDGCGIDLQQLRETIVKRSLTTREVAATLSNEELLEFLFLPGFTMKHTVTEISGRGVGLDVVHSMIKHVHGSIHIDSERGKGTSFHLQLPLSLSVVRCLLVDIGGEPYAFPVAHIRRALLLPRDTIDVVEGRQLFDMGGRSVGLVSAHQVLHHAEPKLVADELPVVVLGEADRAYGLVVDRFLGERELVVARLDARLGKIKDIAAGALMEDGSPALIVDVEDMIRSLEKLAGAGELSTVSVAEGETTKRRKRVLVVDDSLTVRELERKLLDNAGYEVDVAVDGMDAWNAIRSNTFDLIVTDIDMPRMDGLELVALIKQDSNLRHLPVMIVSYKDRQEDRRRGLDAGADYYLTKGSFHDETLLQAAVDLIGEPVA